MQISYPNSSRTFESTQSIVLLNEVFHQKRGQHLPLERRLSNFGPGVPVLGKELTYGIGIDCII